MSCCGRCGKLCAAAASVLSAGCAGVQSALEPVGLEAARINTLLWSVVAFSVVVFIGVFAATVAAIAGKRGWRDKLSEERVIVGAGIVFPIVALSVLLGVSVYVMGLGGSSAAGVGLYLDAEHRERVGTGGGPGLRIAVSGERWWWRVFYITPDGQRIESANELRLPVGEPIAVELWSPDVIHSFWVPKLAGKLDMIPGRINTLTLTATEAGVSRGQCAEYCGGAHALMAFFVVAMPPDEFATWLANETADAVSPESEAEAAGEALFMTRGCGGCHAIRGTDARGTIGPDLTHVGSRLSLGAGILPNDADAFARWTAETQHIKPENLMPSFAIFAQEELRQLALYMDSLE
jgi:cytochrome c oxidase subunit II